MMNISAFCIRRPVTTVLLCISIVLLGLLAYGKLPIAALPSYDTPVISVTATLPGASPESMAASVATPLEKQFAQIGGIATISSVNTLGNTSITLEFVNDRDIDAAAVDVQAALLRAQRSLPVEMTTLPSYRKVNPADAPIILLSISSPSLPLSKLNEYAESFLSPELSTINGVAQLSIFGAQRFAVRIRVKPDALNARGLSLDDVATAIKAANSNTPVGILEGPRQTLIVKANKQLSTAAEFANIIIANTNGQPIRLSDIAEVQDSVENIRTGSWVNGERSIVMAVQRQPNANTVATVNAVIAAIPRLQQRLPNSVELKPLVDRSVSVREALLDIQFTLGLTVALVVMVIFLFLRRVVATLIPALSLPISLIGALSLLYLYGGSLDNVSLLGLTLAVGLVVDDAIVVLENIVRHIEAGLTPMEAALKGAKEIGFTIVSISISLVAIFIPIFFMKGVLGLLFREFAVIVSLSILVSALVSLTLIPLLASRFLKPEHQHQENWLGKLFERGFAILHRAYELTLDWTLRHRIVMLLVALATVVVTALLFQAIPKGFFPDEDTGLLTATTEASEDISSPAMVALQKQVASIVKNNANVDFVVSSVGISNTGNTGRLFIALKPAKQRPAMPQVIESLRRDLRKLSGISVYLTPIQNLRIGGRQSKSRYQYTLQSVQANELNEWSIKLQRAMRENPLFRDVTSDAQLRGLQAALNIDRDKANLLGVNMDALRNTLYSAFGTRQVATIYTNVDSYQVIMEIGNQQIQDEDGLDQIYIKSTAGKPIPLSSFATVERTIGPTAVNHQGQLQAITISFNLAPGASLGEASQRMTALQQTIGMPGTIVTSWGGDAAAFQESQGSQLALLGLALVVIYVLLGVLYESYLHPLTILAGLPSAAVGALATLMLFGQDLTMIAVIGILMLIGIVKKNAIMMIDFAIEAQRERALTPFDAIREACLLRFRPIMMTTLAALMGALPIALGLGAGAELRQPLGLAVVGGLVFSQVITLYITPAIFLGLESLKSQFSGSVDLPKQAKI